MRIFPARLQRKRINNNNNNYNDTARHRTVEYQQSDDASSSCCCSSTTTENDEGDETPSSSISVMTIDSTKALILCEHHDWHHKHNGSDNDDGGIISSSIQNDHNPHNDSSQELTEQDIFAILCGQNNCNDNYLPPTFSFCSNDDMDIIAFDCIEIPDNIPQLGSILTFDYDDDTSTLSNITTTSTDDLTTDDDDDDEAEIKSKTTKMGKEQKMTMTNLSPDLWNANKISKTIQEVLAIVVDSGYYDVFLNVCCDRLRYNAILDVCCCDGIGNIAIKGGEEAATTTHTDGTAGNDVGGGTTSDCSLQFVMAFDNNSNKNEPSQQQKQQPDAVKIKEYSRDNAAIWIPPFDDKMAFPLQGIEMTLMEEDVPYSCQLEASYHDESSTTNDFITLSMISKDCASEEDILSYYLPINNECTTVSSSSSTLFQGKMDHNNDTSAKDRATTDRQVDSQHRHFIKDEILLLSRKNTLRRKRKSFLFRLQRTT